jgi:ATP-dependent DNA helicase PIF1
MDPISLIAAVVGAGWVIGKLPKNNTNKSNPIKTNNSPQSPKIKGVTEKIDILPEYQLAKDLIDNQFPLVFITGGAGTGKSTFVKWLSSMYDGHVLIGAPTGVAAINVEGKTLHSLCVLPPAWIVSGDIKEYKSSLARGAKLLIIDEISMVNANLLDGVSDFFKLNRGVSDKPFGGLPVVMVGDLFQLPPVVNSNVKELFLNTYSTSKFHGAKALTSSPYYAIELSKSFRQVDQQFINLLAHIREGTNLEKTINELNACCNITSNPPLGSVWLSPRNAEVDRRNSAKLYELEGTSTEYKGVLTGKFKDDRLPAPLHIELRNGAQVMFTKNSKKWVNGSIGKVIKTFKDKVHVELMDTQEIVEVAPEKWEQYDYRFNVTNKEIERFSIGSYTQIPLVLAWSITIHKSQGKTIERVHLDLGGGSFETGQTYVALSRCRSLSKLTLSRPLLLSDIKVDPEVEGFYQEIRSLIKTTTPDKIRELISQKQ